MPRGRQPCQIHEKKSSQDYTRQGRCRQCQKIYTQQYRARAKAALKLAREMGLDIPA